MFSASLTGERPAPSRMVPLAAAAAAAFAAAAFAACVVIQRRGRRSRPQTSPLLDEEQKKLMEALYELARRFFPVCVDVATLSKTVYARIEAEKVEVSADRIREQISARHKVPERLWDIQKEVADMYGCTPEDIQDMQRRAAGHPDVIAFTEGFKAMLDSSFEGTPPILPNVKIPPLLTQEKVLEIQADQHAFELDLVVKLVGSDQCELAALQEALALANKGAWDRVFEKHADALQGGRSPIFHSVQVIYLRDPDFKKDDDKLRNKHRQKMSKLFNLKPKPSAGVVASAKAP